MPIMWGFHPILSKTQLNYYKIIDDTYSNVNWNQTEIIKNMYPTFQKYFWISWLALWWGFIEILHFIEMHVKSCHKTIVMYNRA